MMYLLLMEHVTDAECYPRTVPFVYSCLVHNYIPVSGNERTMAKGIALYKTLKAPVFQLQSRRTNDFTICASVLALQSLVLSNAI